MEDDLEKAEDRADDNIGKVKALKTENEDLKRENGKLRRDLTAMEGKMISVQ